MIDLLFKHLGEGRRQGRKPIKSAALCDPACEIPAGSFTALNLTLHAYCICTVLYRLNSIRDARECMFPGPCFRTFRELLYLHWIFNDLSRNQTLYLSRQHTPDLVTQPPTPPPWSSLAPRIGPMCDIDSTL